MDILGLQRRLIMDAQRLREDAAEMRECELQGKAKFLTGVIESLEREAAVLDDAAKVLVTGDSQ